MASDSAKPPYNAKRRIQLLFGFSVFLIIAATAGWYFVAGKIDEAAQAAIDQQRQQGTRIECANRDVKGYPFRFGIFCDSLQVSVGSRGPSLTAGQFRSAAQFYDPYKVLLEMDAPATLSVTGGEPFEFDWRSLRASVIVDQPLPEAVSIVAANLVGGPGDEKVSAESAEIHFRTVSSDIDFAARVAAFGYQGQRAEIQSLPALGVDIDLRIMNLASELATNPNPLRGRDGMLNRAALMIDPDKGILVSGPFSINRRGLVSGDILIRIVDVDAVTSLLSDAFPQQAGFIEAFLSNQPRKGEKGDEVELNVTIADGKVRLGLIPLGEMPPL